MTVRKTVLLLFLVSALLVVLALILSFPLLYNTQLHPLARLAGSLEEGDAYDDVSAWFEDYNERRQDNGTIELNTSTSDGCEMVSLRGKTSRCLSIYDKALFDTVYLIVAFDENDGLIGKSYRGD